MYLTDDVQVAIKQQTKFKDITISLRFRTNIEPSKAAARSLLALMMIDRTSKYDTKQKLSQCQDSLYGASIRSNKVSFGKSDIFAMRMTIINPMYLNEDDHLLEDSLSLLHEVLFNPLLNEETFKEQKNSLLQRIQRALDEPSYYVVNHTFKQFDNLPLGINSAGTIELIEKLTLLDVQNAYQDMMLHDKVDILVCGDVNEEKMTRYLKEYLPFTPRHKVVENAYHAESDVPVKKEVIYKDITQSYICMVWFTNCDISMEDYFALNVANAMLGRYSTSLLFQEVREKRSLCYSIESSVIAYDGVLAVITGVDKENIDETIELIHKQYEKMCFGYFEDNLLEVTKKMLVNSYKSTQDNQNAIMGITYENMLLNRQYTYEDYITKVENVTKEDVMMAMQRCEYKVCTILTKEDEHE